MRKTVHVFYTFFSKTRFLEVNTNGTKITENRIK